MSLETAAKRLAAKGRHGDSTLVHMAPKEVAGLQALAKAHGTSLTVNPKTGLPEAFSLKSILPMIASGVAGFFSGGNPYVAGAAGAATTKLMGGSNQAALMSGVGGAFGAGSVGGGLASSGEDIAAQEAAQQAAQEQMMASATPSAADPNLLTTEGGATINQQTGEMFNEDGSPFSMGKSPSMGDRFDAWKTQMGGGSGVGKAGLGLLAQSAAVDPTPPDKKKLDQHLRPYALNVRRGAPSGTDSREQQQVGYDFTPGPVQDVSTYAAQGGIMRLAAGGSAKTIDATIMPVPNPQGSGKRMAGLSASSTGAYNPAQIYGAGKSGAYDPSKIYGAGATPPNLGPPQMGPRAPMPAPHALVAGTTLGKYNFDPASGQFSITPDWQQSQDASAAAASAAQAAPAAPNPSGDKNGGIIKLAAGGMPQGHLGDYSDGGRLLRGPGDGVSDSIPASIDGKRPARLADGEFVIPARHVSELGNGSTEAGSRKLYGMLDRIQNNRKKSMGKGKGSIDSKTEKLLPA